ncbi:hypothetical protein DFJ74DRAFT_487960, partial [Hyaloraphidium curvatum]
DNATGADDLSSLSSRCWLYGTRGPRRLSRISMERAEHAAPAGRARGAAEGRQRPRAPPTPRGAPARGRFLGAAFLLGCAAALLALGWSGAAAAPPADMASKVVETAVRFDHAPRRLVYFKDSEVILILSGDAEALYRSADQGKTWTMTADIPKGAAKVLMRHEHDPDTAFVLTDSTTHYITRNKGLSWTTFDTPLAPAFDTAGYMLGFHSGNSNYLLFQGKKCVPVFLGLAQKCHEDTFVSTSTSPSFEPLLEYTTSCVWARSNPAFTNPPDKAVYCTEAGADGKLPRLVYSGEFFKGSKTTVTLGGGDDGEVVNGAVVGLGVIERFMVVAVAAQSATVGAELFVSVDGQTFRRARFPVGFNIRENAYTILPSAPHALFIDLSSTVRNPTGSHPSFTGTLLISDATGSRYVPALEHTNRDATTGKVDFERVDIGKGGGIYEGILMANVVQNWEEVEKGTTRFKDVVTRWSWDDGFTWAPLRGPPTDNEGKAYKCSLTAADPCDLHLHSSISGESTFSSPAPGVLLGVGSVGKKLLPTAESDTFLSTDGGATWKAVGKGEWEYAVGDIGALIVMARESQIRWSPDHGRTWFDHEVKGAAAGKKLAVERVLTMPDSSSAQFLVLAYAHDGQGKEGPVDWHAIHLDFGGVWGRKCGAEDMELWKPRDYVGGSDCILGQELGWYRRKPNAECYVGEVGKDVRTEVKKCACTPADYACDLYFEHSGSASDPLNCTLKAWPDNRDPDMPRGCRDGEKYSSRSAYVKKPGDACEGGQVLDAPVDRVCGADGGAGGGGGIGPAPEEPRSNGTIGDAPSSIKISTQITSMSEADITFISYFKRSPVVVLRTLAGEVWWSGDEGGKWTRVLSDLGKVEMVILSDVAEKRAYFLTAKGETWYTEDRLEGYATEKDKAGSLRKMELPAGLEWNRLGVPVFDFHPTEPDWLVLVAQPAGKCPGRDCKTLAYTSIDHGRTWSTNPWDTWVRKCLWAQDVNFTASALTRDSVYCSGWKIKDGKFGGQEQLESGLVSPKENPVEFAEYANAGTKRVLFEQVSDWYVVSGFLVVALDDGSKLKLMVSVDGLNFAEAQFPPYLSVEKNGFTLLDSHPGTIYLDVAGNTRHGQEQGNLFVSNSNGTFFTQALKNTNRNSRGLVDYEKSMAVEGVILANRVLNPTGASTGDKKQVGSVVSFDNGATWNEWIAPSKDSLGQPYKCPSSSKCMLHIHSITDTDPESTMGSLFSSESAPGIMVAVGNVGDRLNPYTMSDTYMSTDAGAHWREIAKGPHQWEFGDRGSVIILVNDESATDELLFTLDYGANWYRYKFSKDGKIRVKTVTTEPKGTSLRFLLVGYAESAFGRSRETVLVQVDFSQAFARKCTFSADFEKWVLTGTDDKPDCVLGRRTYWWRRLPTADCYIGDLYTDSRVIVEDCECSAADYECDVTYWRDENTGKCTLYGADPDAPKDCKPGEKYTAPSGYRKNALSTCKGGVDLSGKVEKVCGQDSDPSDSVAVKRTVTTFDSLIEDWTWFVDTTTVLARDSDGKIWKSDNEGKDWDDLLKSHRGEKDRDGLEKDTKVIDIIPNPYDRRYAYFITQSKYLWYTPDAGKTVKEILLPLEPNILKAPILKFHRDHPEWLIFVGSIKGCHALSEQDCHTEAYFSTDGGRFWKSLTTYVEACSWGRDAQFQHPTDTVLFCQAYQEKKGNQRGALKDNRLRLLRTENFFANGETGEGSQVVVDNSLGFALFESFMVVAEMQPGAGHLDLFVSVDGTNFARAQFPPNFRVPSHGYTVLESSTGRVFLDVYSHAERGSEWGSLMISNWNGTYYSVAVDNTNRNALGYVDFEKMQGIQGIALVNQVTNPKEAEQGADKKVKTLITFDDGSTWSTVTPPERAVDGTPYSSCAGGCSLNIHSYTERRDPRMQFSQLSAPGLMMGVGNVGPYLTKYTDGNTYLTRDAGRTWIEVHKDAFMFEYGDHGSILLMVFDEGPTDKVLYSLTMGLTWLEYRIVDSMNEKIRITDIATEPDSTSQQFVLFGRYVGSARDGQQAAIHLNFEGARSRKCKLDESDPSKSDFELWSPTAANHTECHFGHEIQYWRKKREADCFVGDKFQETPKVVQKNCACTRADFECDFNYRRDSDGRCVLVSGAARPQLECIGGRAQLSTGYRKMVKSTCQGGEELDKGTEMVACVAPSGGMGVGGVVGLIVLFVAIFGSAIAFLDYYRKQHSRIMLPDDDFGLMPGSRSSGNLPPWLNAVVDYSIAAFHTAAHYIAIGATWLWERAQDGYDWVVFKASNGRAGGYAGGGGRSQYRPLDGSLAGPEDRTLMLDDVY